MRFALAALALMVVVPVTATAREPFEGFWARSQRECKDEDGPNSRTMIDLEDDKVGPLFDQYEHHCKIVRRAAQGEIRRFEMKCYEFWENFTKNLDSRVETVVLRQGRNTRLLSINGKAYTLCKRL